MRDFPAQADDIGDQRRVVEFGIAEFGGTGDIGAVHAFAQCAVIGVLQHRHVRGRVQREFPAGLFVRFGCGTRGIAGVIGQAGEFGSGGDQMRPGIGGIEQVVAETRGQHRQPVADFGIALFAGGRQIGAAKAEIAHFVADDFLLRRAQRGKSGTGAQRLELAVQPFMLAKFGVVLGDSRQDGVVRFAQLGAVHHRIEVADLTPGAMQAFIRIFQRPDKIVPVRRRGICGQSRDQCAVFGEQLVDRRSDMRGFEIGKTGQARKIE